MLSGEVVDRVAKRVEASRKANVEEDFFTVRIAKDLKKFLEESREELPAKEEGKTRKESVSEVATRLLSEWRNTVSEKLAQGKTSEVKVRDHEIKT